MTTITKFNDLTILEHGVILKNRKKEEREISFSELDKIFIKVYKLKPVCELGIIVLPFLLIFLAVHYLALEKVIFVGLTAVIPVFVKINNFKSYGLRICLKDGTVFRKRISLDEKDDTISIVNAVRKEQLIHYVKINAPNTLEVLEFC